MSPSEIAFLALGLVLGAAIGAAIVEAVRSRPAPRREVRVTIAPNSVLPRRNTTLAAAMAAEDTVPIPRLPGGRRMAGAVARLAARDRRRRPRPGSTRPPPVEHAFHPGRRACPRRRSPSPSSARCARRDRQVRRTQRRLDPGPRGPGAPRAALDRLATAVSVLDPVEPERLEPERRAGRGLALPAVLDVGEVAAVLAVRPRPPAEPARIEIPLASVPVAVEATREGPVGELGGAGPGTGSPGAQGGSADRLSDPCGAPRQLVEERCAVATASREQAAAAADALRAAQREYDALRERVERAQADSDPRAIAAAKDSLHKQFRIATSSAMGAEDTEAAAREWLTRINEVNNRARDAARVVESGSAGLRAALPRLDRLSLEADAARIGAETAEAACHEARERLAACEEDQAARRLVAPVPGGGGEPEPDGWRDEPSSALVAPPAGAHAAVEGRPAIVRILRGDRMTRERLVATIATDDPEDGRAWHLRLAALVDAISARAIEDGYLDMPDDDPFWGMFTARECREIVGALSALGFRFDGLGGFADERVPAPRDLSLAVGYAGQDRMRIRNWPHEADLPGLFSRATIAADEWLANEAGDLSLGEMVDALGSRAGELADVWNAWGRLRPLLVAED